MEWDARLTSVLILFLMYSHQWRCGARWRTLARGAGGGGLDLVGAINILIICSVMREHAAPGRVETPRRRPDPRPRLPDPAAGDGKAFSLLFVTLHLAAMRNEVLRRRVRTLQMMLSRQAAWIPCHPVSCRSAPTPPSLSRSASAALCGRVA